MGQSWSQTPHILSFIVLRRTNQDDWFSPNPPKLQSPSLSLSQRSKAVHKSHPENSHPDPAAATVNRPCLSHLRTFAIDPISHYLISHCGYPFSSTHPLHTCSPSERTTTTTPPRNPVKTFLASPSLSFSNHYTRITPLLYPSHFSILHHSAYTDQPHWPSPGVYESEVLGFLVIGLRIYVLRTSTSFWHKETLLIS